MRSQTPSMPSNEMAVATMKTTMMACTASRPRNTPYETATLLEVRVVQQTLCRMGSCSRQHRQEIVNQAMTAAAAAAVVEQHRRLSTVSRYLKTFPCPMMNRTMTSAAAAVAVVVAAEAPRQAPRQAGRH